MTELESQLDSTPVDPMEPLPEQTGNQGEAGAEVLDQSPNLVVEK